LVEKKGFADLVTSCAKLREHLSGFKCIIVGDGPLHGQLAAQIARLGLQEHVVLAGPRPQEDLIGLMRQATIFALPCVVTASGDRDGLPTVLLEALASGLPAVSTDVSGVPEIIEHHRTGMLVRQNAPGEFAAAMAALLSSPGLRRTIAEAGRKKAEADFDLGRNVGTLRAWFEASAGAGTGEADEYRLRVG
jgi:glycosyltransferase involved in cell wall biosynthesis